MEYKKIDELSISECCAELNIESQQLPIILENISGPQEIVDRLKLLVDADMSAFKSCSTIEQFEKYLELWIDGLHRSEASQRVAQLKAQAEELALYKTNQNSISGLESYIKKYPNGRFIQEAKGSLANKKKARKIRNIILLIIAIVIAIVVCLINYFPVSYLDVSGDVSLGKRGGNKTITISTDAIDANIDVKESSDWISVNRDGKSLSINVMPNKYDEKTAYIIVNACSSFFGKQFNWISKKIKVTQESALATYLEVNLSKINFDKYGKTAENYIKAETDGCDMQISSTAPWLTISENVEEIGNKLVANITLNTNINKEGYKTGEVIIRCNDYEKRIKVSQASGLATFLKVDHSKVNFDKYGKSSLSCINVETDGCDLQVSTSASWFSVSKNITEDGENMVASIVLTTGTNNEGSKNGEVVIRCNDYVEKVKVSQASGLSTYFRVEKTSLTMAEEGSGEGMCYPINIYTDGTSWSVKSAPDWLTANATSSRLEVSVGANTGKIKSGTITVMSNNGDLRDISVSQNGDPTNFGTAKSSIKFGTSSDYEYVTIYNDSHKNLEINEYEDWLSATAIGNDEIKISCTSNSNESRSGTVYVHCGDEQISITVKQDGWTTCWNCGGHGRFQCSYPGLWGAGGYHYVQEFVMNYYTGMGNYVYNPCPNCGGSGTIKCSKCDGTGKIKKSY